MTKKSKRLSECEKGHRRWISGRDYKPKPVFKNCNVCGRQLIRKDELACGMCAICVS